MEGREEEREEEEREGPAGAKKASVSLPLHTLLFLDR